MAYPKYLNGRLARAQSSPKIQKEFVNLPKFWPIGDTTRIVHYQLRKHLSELFNPLTYNEYTIRDSFDAVTRIKNIPQELLDQGYRFVSFDAVSLFTNEPLQKTSNIVLKKVFVEKVINTTMKKDNCKKTNIRTNWWCQHGVTTSSSISEYHHDRVRKHHNKKVIRYRENKVLLLLCRWYPAINKTRGYTIGTRYV